MAYTKAEIIQKLEDAAMDMAVFYRQDFINYRGNTVDTNERYTEVIAEWCCEHPAYFELIPRITRKASYKSETHLGIYDPHSTRTEEIIAMRMFRYCQAGGSYAFIGKVLDYQTPLKNTRSDKAGKVDLLAYDGKTLRLLELKKPDTPETMLRCVLEGFTYLKTADQEKLLRDFSLPDDTQVEACPLVFQGSIPHQEMQQEHKQLERLMVLLNSKPYYLQEYDDRYTVWEQ